MHSADPMRLKLAFLTLGKVASSKWERRRRSQCARALVLRSGESVCMNRARLGSGERSGLHARLRSAPLALPLDEHPRCGPARGRGTWQPRPFLVVRMDDVAWSAASISERTPHEEPPWALCCLRAPANAPRQVRYHRGRSPAKNLGQGNAAESPLLSQESRLRR